ncbi:MAG: hypothetical protein KAR20_13220, partial [Candidatus Heimdallarchaeota archaeon]|nr:hypothetical protein [Candidatus Heimdallarchaeota archaeon]
FLTFPYPIELRETASIHPAYALANGINPYSLESFPEYIYTYGILYPLTLSPFINMADHPLLVARTYNVLFLGLFSGLSFWIFRKQGASKTTSSIGVLILINSMCLIWAWNGVRPEAPALFFSFLGFYFMGKDDYSYKSIVLSAVTCVLSLHFKQYLLFSALVIAVYLFLFVSKKKGYIFAGSVTIFSVVSFVVLTEFFPLYYNYSVLFHLNAGDNMRSTSHLMLQSKEFFQYYWILLFFFLFHLYKVVSGSRLDQFKKIRFKPFNLTEPFVNFFLVDIYTVGVIISAATLTLWLGKHAGNVYTYYGELLLPFLLYLVIPKIDEWFKNDLYLNLGRFLILIFCVFPFRGNYNSNFNAWHESFLTLEKYYEKCTNVYDRTSLAALYKIEHNMSPVYNNGHVQYARTLIPNIETIPGRISNIPAEFLEQRLFEWNSKIEHNINNQKFDCIFSRNEVIEHYKQVALIENASGWKVIVQIPDLP